MFQFIRQLHRRVFHPTTTKTQTTHAAVSETVLPELPAEGETTNEETGETTTVKVTELRDASGALTGYEVTTTTTDSEGNVRTAVETLRSKKDTGTLTETTDVTVTTVMFTKVTGGTVTTTTRTTTTETKRIAASDRTVTRWVVQAVVVNEKVEVSLWTGYLDKVEL